jgi:sugar phosphate isomerase/epimerase
MQQLIEKIQIHIPFGMLYESYLDLFIKQRINPEIALSADALESYSFTDFNYIAEQLKEKGLRITLHAPFMDLSPGAQDPAIREITRHRFDQVLKLVPIFKPITVVCHTGYDWKKYWPMRDSWIENSLKIWSWLGAGIKDEGSQLILENVYEHDPGDILILLESLKSQNVGFCLDIGHQTVFSRSSLVKWIDSLGPYIRQLHLHDNYGERDDHMALGSGNIDFPKLFKLLKNSIDELTVITLEPHKEKDLWLSLEYLKKVWPWQM